MIQGLLSIAAAVIGATVASYAVMLFTIPKIRKERGFDRRLTWCESMMGALNSAGAAVTSSVTGPHPAGREEYWTETIKLYEQLIPLCGLKELYAPKPAIEAINAFMHELATLIDSHLASHCINGFSADYEKCLAELRRAATSLAKIGRDHLGLEPLPDALTDPSRRFLGSFRGRELGQHKAASS